MTGADEWRGALVDRESTPGSASSAVAQLFREHNRVLVRSLAVRLRSTHEANEVAQEAYARLLRLEQQGTPSLLRAYLFKIATNIAIDRLRHRKLQRQVEEQPELMNEMTATPRHWGDPAELALAREQT